MGNKYRIGRKIGSGSFGDIYLGEAKISHTIEGADVFIQAPTSSPVKR